MTFAAQIPFLRALDRWRGEVLRVTMRSSAARAIYLDRTYRLVSLCLATMLVQFLLASAAPLWLLALSPVVWGLPHLVASLRYTARAGARPDRVVPLLALLSLGLIALRLSADFGGAQSWVFQDRRLELLGLAVVPCLLGAASLGRVARATACLAPLIVAGLLFPGIVLGLLLFGHHFVAFFFWYRSARAGRDRRAVLGLLGVFALLHVLVLGGSADALFFRVPGFMELPFAGLELGTVGYAIFGDFVQNPLVWFRLVVAFAFGQSVHYFVWLRAIPEQHLPRQTPTNFRQSVWWLRRDLGPVGAKLAVLLTLAASFGWILLEFPVARTAYVAVAAFHGFAEIAALALPAGRA